MARVLLQEGGDEKEDEVIEAYVKEMISSSTIDPKSVQTDLKGFMGAGPAATIMKELWELMLEAQTTKDGIPTLLKGPAGEREPELSTAETLRKKVQAISSKILGGGNGDDLRDSFSHAKGAWGQGSGEESSRSGFSDRGGFSDDRGGHGGNDHDRERFRDDRRDYRESSHRESGDVGRDREREGDRWRNRSRSPVRRDRSRSPPRY